MGLPHSTYYDAPAAKAEDAEIVAAMTAICDNYLHVWPRASPSRERLKDLELENSRLRKAVSDLTLDKLILVEAANGNF